MILNSLYDCYDLLAKDPQSGIAPQGYTRASCAFAIVLNGEGEAEGILPLGDEKKGEFLIVPEQSARSSGIKPFFLCDKSKYFFGVEYDKKKKTLMDFPKHLDAAKQEHERILEGCEDETGKAVLRFFEKVSSGYRPDIAEDHPVYQGGLLVFRMSHVGYLHENLEIRERWEAVQLDTTQDSQSVLGQCLLTGEEDVLLARTHSLIKGIKGAQPAGAALVSFNGLAFTSYGKSQSYNAPVSQKAMIKYTSALNYLLTQQKNKKILGDTTVVFWTKRGVHGCEVDFISDMCFGGNWQDAASESEEAEQANEATLLQERKLSGNEKKEKNDGMQRNLQAEKTIGDLVDRVRRGSILSGIGGVDIDFDTETYLLGLAPNNARLAVRFWYQNRLEDFARRGALHYMDMEIAKPSKGKKYASIRDILKNMSVLGDLKNVPASLVRSLFDAIFTGSLYPRACFQAMLTRICCEAGEDYAINFVKVGFIKAYLLRYYRVAGRKEKEEEITVSLNAESNSVGYQLGRLFAILENLQYQANDGNTTIRGKYFSSAMATPSVAYTNLLKLAQAHINKVKYGTYWDKQIAAIINRIEGTFPSTLSTEEQGMFILGFYQQKQWQFEEYEKGKEKSENAKMEQPELISEVIEEEK